MFTEILSCLTLLASDIDYGTPKTFAKITLVQDAQRTDIFYITTEQDFFRCTSSIPLNQNVQIHFTKLIQGLPQKIQYIETPTPRTEESQKQKIQVYKSSAKTLFKHEKINQFSTPVFSEMKATAICDTIKKNSVEELKSYEAALLKMTTLEVKDSLADWSEYMDSEDYGYDKSSKEREKSKKLYTEKLKNNLIKCQKSPYLDLVARSVIEKLDLYLGSTGPSSTKVLDQKIQVQKTSVPVNK
jgi:hypothetical protein